MAQAQSGDSKTPKFGQDAKAIPGFDSKSAVVPAADAPPPGASVNTGAAVTDRAANVIYYRYKGVDLPLKKFLEYDGSQPFVQIVDGKDVLWVARRADVYRMLDRVLYGQLDTMTGAADDLYQRHRYPAAFDAYGQILDVLSAPANELKTPDLEHYPAIKSYLQFRMGQCRSWNAHMRWADAERDFELADQQRAAAAIDKNDPPNAFKVPVEQQEAVELDADARTAAADAQRLTVEAKALLEQAAGGNDRLWQAHDELGILATERAERAMADGDLEASEREYRTALDLFKKAKVTADAKETVDSNLIAVYSALADIAHTRQNYGEALDDLRQAMELTPDAATDDSGKAAGPVAYQVSFSRFHPSRGEAIVVTAELQAGIARKYLEIERDMKTAAGRPKTPEAESEISAMWRTQGDRIVKHGQWGRAVAFYTALHDEYLSQATSSVSPEFRAWVQKNLEKSFGERGTSLLRQGRTDEALQLYALALDYLPNSRVLNQAAVMQAFRRADSAIAGGRWEEALGQLDAAKTVYGTYSGDDPEKKKTQDELSQRYGTAYVALTHAALDRGDFDKAGAWADLAYHLAPARPDWLENKGRVLLEQARSAEKGGDKEGALALYRQAGQIAVGPVKIRSAFAADTLRVELMLPKVRDRAVATTRTWGLPFTAGALGLVLGGYGLRNGMAASNRRRSAKRSRKQAQKAYDEKRWNEAVDLFNDYLAQNVGAADPEAYELLARSYRKIGDYENALRFFDRAANRLPGRRYNLERAEIYLMRRNLPLAVQALRGSATLPADAEKLVHFLNYLREKDGESLFVTEALAQVQITAGDIDAGRQLYLRLLDLDPRSVKTLRALAEIARKAGQARERRTWLERLVAAEPSDAASLRELGNLLAAEGELGKALEALRRALEINPGEGLAARIAELSAEQLVREAESEIARLQREQDTPNRRFRIGELHWRLGRGAEAKKFFEETAQIKEYQARALRYLGLIALADRNATDAVSMLRGYLAKRTNLAPDAPEKEARYALAEAYEMLEQKDLASAQYDAIFEADPNYKDVARKVQSRMATKGLASKGPQDCPFCKRRVPGDAEYCPHCNFHLAANAPSKYGGTPTAETKVQPWQTPDPKGGPGSSGGPGSDGEPTGG